MDTSTALKDFIQKELAIGAKKDIQLEDDLLSTGVMDSLGLMQLVLFVEEKLGVHVPDEDVVIENFRSIRALADYLEKRNPAQA